MTLNSVGQVGAIFYVRRYFGGGEGGPVRIYNLC